MLQINYTHILHTETYVEYYFILGSTSPTFIFNLFINLSKLIYDTQECMDHGYLLEFRASSNSVTISNLRYIMYTLVWLLLYSYYDRLQGAILILTHKCGPKSGEKACR